MKTNHTPGPWKAKQQFYDEYSYVILWPDKNGEHMKRIDANGEFKKQDANLIAAAPDMLEALIRAEQHLDAMLSITTENYGAETLSPRYKESLDMVREAIRKAKGL